MGTASDKLNYLKETKALFKESLIAKGVAVSDDTPFSEYGDLIESISTGLSLNIAYGDTAPEDTSKLWVNTSNSKTDVSIVQSQDEAFLRVPEVVLPVALRNACVQAVDSNIYIMGGTPLGSSYNMYIYIFDTTAESITKSDTYGPICEVDYSSAVVGAKIYTFGGYNTLTNTGINTIRRYDTEAGAVTKLSETISSLRYNITTASVGTKIYLFGGYVNNDGSKGVSSAIQVFDTETETISTLSVILPAARYRATASAVGTKIYLFGGRYSTGTALGTDTIYMFDTESETITLLDTKLPVALNNISSSVVGNKIYLFGGDGGNYKHVNTVYVFDTETQSIVKLDCALPRVMREMGIAKVGQKIYLFGGHTNDGTAATDTIVVANTDGLIFKNQLVICTEDATYTHGIIDSDGVSIQTDIGAVYVGSEGGTVTKATAYLYENNAWTEI